MTTSTTVASMRKDRMGFKSTENNWYEVQIPLTDDHRNAEITFDVIGKGSRGGDIAGNIVITKMGEKWNANKSGGYKSGGSSYSGAKKAGGYDNVGQQIGNCISNATLLVCHGKVKLEDLEKVARRLFEIGTNMKDKPQGTTSPKKERTTYESTPPPPAPPSQSYTPNNDEPF